MTDAPIKLTSTHELFLDDYLIERSEKLTLRVNPVRKHPRNPVIRPTEDWEPRGYIAFGSVLHDPRDGLYKAWCMALGGLEIAPPGVEACAPALCYFTSDDGIEWERPQLDVVRMGAGDTNIVAFGGEGDQPAAFEDLYEFFGVSIHDTDPDPDRRFKMGFLHFIREYDGADGHPTYPGQQRGLGVAFSPDGIHWQRHPGWVTHATGDGYTSWMRDPRSGRWVLYGRGRHIAPEVRQKWSEEELKHHWGRAVTRAESDDFIHWEPEFGDIILSSDTEDGPMHEIYGMSVFPYEDIYIGLVQMFYNYPEHLDLDLQLAVSRDGRHFRRLSDRSAFIPVGGVGEWDRMNNSPANSEPLRVGDELRFYYGGRNERHNSIHRLADDGILAALPFTGGVGMGSVPVDRFAGLEASFDTGRLVTRPLLIDAETIHVNADVRFGLLEVRVLRETGEPIRGCGTVILSENGVDIPLLMDLPALPAGMPVRLELRLTNGRLYSIWAD